MRGHIVGMAVAAAFATAVVSAQSTQPGQTEQQAGARQQVTVEGCLQQQEMRAAAQDAPAAAASEGKFVLLNAQVKSGSDAAGTRAEAAGAAATGNEGPAAQAAQAVQADRPAGQTGTESGTAVGTSGVAGTAAYTAGSYKIVGLDDDRLKVHAGERVRLVGHIETKDTDIDGDRPGTSAADRSGAGTTTGADTQPTGTTGTGIAGHGQAGTTAGTQTGMAGAPSAGAPGASHDHSRMAAAGSMKEFRATSIERVAGGCPESR